MNIPIITKELGQQFCEEFSFVNTTFKLYM